MGLADGRKVGLGVKYWIDYGRSGTKDGRGGCEESKSSLR
jgi:hypothetical protein